MDEPTLELIGRLTAARSGRWLRVIADARLDDPVEPEPDPAAVVTPYRWLIEAVGDGVKLSQAGYLPPGLVERAMAELGWAETWPGKNNREDHTIPIRDLRESAQRLGLLRKYKGQLLVTALGRKLAQDPEALWWHLAERLPDARSELERHAGVSYLLLVAAGRPHDDHMLAEALTALGWVDRTTRTPISDHDAFFAARDTWDMFRRLGVLPEHRSWDEPEPTPTDAAIRLARAALVGRDAPVRTARPRLRVVGADTGQLVQLTVTLRDVTPPVWRRLAVPASLTLRELHEVIQTAMGWQATTCTCSRSTACCTATSRTSRDSSATRTRPPSVERRLRFAVSATSTTSATAGNTTSRSKG